MSEANIDQSEEIAGWLSAIAQSHDRNAFVALFNAISGKLKAYAIRCGAHDAEAEEIVQESMLVIWRKAHLFDPNKAKATTWIYTIVRNKRIDFARKATPERVTSGDIFPEQGYEHVEKDVQSDLNAEYVRKILESLPEEQRIIVQQIYFEGKTHSELADEFGIALGTVKSRLRLAMKKLNGIANEQATWLIIILTTSI